MRPLCGLPSLENCQVILTEGIESYRAQAHVLGSIEPLIEISYRHRFILVLFHAYKVFYSEISTKQVSIWTCIR
jgi:hypothetical protein